MGTPHPSTTMQGLKKYRAREVYTIHCTLVLPYLEYCVILWGITYKSKLKALTTLQKRAMRIVLKTSRQSHIRPIFYELKALYFDDIISVNIAAFTHKAFYKELPQRIQSKFLLNDTIHKYGMMGKKNFDDKAMQNSSLMDQNTGIMCIPI